MNNALSTRILLRKDTAEQWEQFNPILLNGEMAVVIENDGNIRLKVGDGSRSYQQLPFINHAAIETNSIAQGMQAFARPYGMAGGFRVSADSQFAQAFGINATTNGDNYSFVWNGDNDLTHDAYTSHGSGTFSVNPINGLSGFFIGDQNLSDVIYTEIERKSTTYVDGEKKDLSVFQISLSDYMEGVKTSSLLSDAIYIVSSDVRYMFGERITDLAEPELSSDAATKNYVDAEIAKIDVSGQLTGYALKNNISVLYESASKKIKLNADGYVTEIDATDFIKDGMIDSARYDVETKQIILTFNTDADKTPISVGLESLVDVYTAGTGLSVENNQFFIDEDVVATKEYVDNIFTFEEINLTEQD